MIHHLILYFAQAYGEGVFGSDVYQVDNSGSTNNASSEQTVVTAPSTGFIDSTPEVLAPIILGVSIVVAVIVTIIKKQINKSRR